HPQRFDRVAELVTRQGFTLSRRTDNNQLPPVQVYLGDTMGELPVMLAAADVAFIGGSLIERGGHNLLEPAALGKPVLTGPSFFNFNDITRQLVDAGGALVVTDSDELSRQLHTLLSSPEHSARMGDRALNVVTANQGALVRTLTAIATQLDL
ncbi:MAG: glycosyltransferase, partial [Oceanisphaera sp.]|nr:glycosyltransferase [Oceanisphaera sp.]